MIKYEEIEYRIQSATENLKYWSKELITTKDDFWYDECVRQIDHEVKHLNALIYTLSVYHEVLEDSEKQNVCPLCNIILSEDNSVNSAYHAEETVCYDCYIKAKGE